MTRRRVREEWGAYLECGSPMRLLTREALLEPARKAGLEEGKKGDNA